WRPSHTNSSGGATTVPRSSIPTVATRLPPAYAAQLTMPLGASAVGGAVVCETASTGIRRSLPHVAARAGADRRSFRDTVTNRCFSSDRWCRRSAAASGQERDGLMSKQLRTGNLYGDNKDDQG